MVSPALSGMPAMQPRAPRKPKAVESKAADGNASGLADEP